MLTKLPFEVSCNIIQYLETPELLLCSTSCRDWHNFIKKRQLIRVLEPVTAKQLNSVINAIDNQYIDGSQITSLKTRCPPNDLDIPFTDLPRYFPKLKKLDYNTKVALYNNTPVITEENVKVFKEWQPCLESFAISGRVYEMMLLMMKCPFERLFHLHIGFDEEDDLSGNLHTGAIAALKYLPQLKSLVICGNLLSFDSLEQIHRFLPSLEQLELKYSMTTFPKGIPIDIAPANKLTHFTCETERCDKNEQFVLQYILAKYPSLVHLYLSYDLIVTNSQLILIEYIASEMEPALLSFISQLPLTLTSFKSQSYRTTKPVIDTVARLSNMNEFHLCIDHRTGHDVATLEYCHSKGVLQSLERLWITAQYFNDIGTDVEFETSLKELNIDLVYERPLEPRNIFHFDSVFKVHPLLESLSIAAEGYGVDIGNGIEIDQLNVRELSLRVDILSDRVIPFIRNTMPYLKRLSLEVYNNGLSSEDGGGYEDEDGNKEIMVAHFSGKELSLPNHCLEHLSITAPLLRHNIICSVSSIIENKRKYYLFSQSESKVKYCGMEPPNVKEKKDEVYHYIDIHCKELWHLTVGDIEVF